MPRPGIETSLESAPYDPRLARRMFAYLRPYRGLIVVAVALALAQTVFSLWFEKLGKDAVNAFKEGFEAATGAGEQSALERFYRLLPWFAALPALAAALGYFQMYLVQYLGQRAMFALRRDVFARLQQLSVAYFDRNPVGRLMTRVTNDVETLNQLLSVGIVQAVADVFMLMGIGVFMLHQDWRIALVLFVTAGPLLLLATNLFRVFARAAFRLTRKKVAELNSYLQENISGMRITQVFNREARNFAAFVRLNDQYRRANYRTTYCYAPFFAVVEWFGALSAALILWYGGGRQLRETVSLGGLFLFMRLAERAFEPIRDLSEKYNMLQSAMAAAERIFGLLDERPEIANAPGAIVAPAVVDEIEFDDVWFAYVGEEWVLRGVSFTVARGQTVALVGATGSGKSTIVNLLLRFYEVQRGAIRVNGVDIRQLRLDSLRARMAIVLQDVFLFNDTIAGNIRLGDATISDADVRRAAETVHAARFIDAYDNGYQRLVGERGVTLSVGQKQLLSFARALAFDPQILILDEATASVDTETELLIQDALGKLFAGRSSLVVAHRLSTIQRAQLILVMSHGRIIERGSHQELLALNGVYKRLCDLQYREELVS